MARGLLRERGAVAASLVPGLGMVVCDGDAGHIAAGDRGNVNVDQDDIAGAGRQPTAVLSR